MPWNGARSLGLFFVCGPRLGSGISGAAAKSGVLRCVWGDPVWLYLVFGMGGWGGPARSGTVTGSRGEETQKAFWGAR